MPVPYMIIEVCDANLACTNELFQLESEFPGVTVLETACMSECELCMRSPYLFFDGELTTAPTVTELLVIIRNKLQELDEVL